MEQLKLRDEALSEQKRIELAPFMDYYKRLGELRLAIGRTGLDETEVAEEISYNLMLGGSAKDKGEGSIKMKEILSQRHALDEQIQKLDDQYVPMIEPINEKYFKLFLEIEDKKYKIRKEKEAFTERLIKQADRDQNKRESTLCASERDGASDDQEKIEVVDKEIAKIGAVLEKNRDKDSKNDVESQMVPHLITQYLGLKKMRSDWLEARKGGTHKAQEKDEEKIKALDAELEMIKSILAKNRDTDSKNDLHLETAMRFEKRLQDLLQKKRGLTEDD